MLTSTELTYFFEIANTLNLSRASERLGISQPSLSNAIKRMESAIGTPLLIRHKKGVTLTQAGKQLLGHAKNLIQYWDKIKANTLASHDEVQGSFSIGCHPSVALSYLPSCLPILLKTYPKLEIKLVHDLSRKINEQIINFSIDIGIVVNPIKHPDLILKKLTHDEFGLWQGEELNSDTIICDTDLAQVQWILNKLDKKGFNYSRIITSNYFEVIAQLTAENAGIGILPRSVASKIKKLKPIAKLPIYQDEIYLVYRAENRDIKAIQMINEAIKSIFKK